MKKAMLAAMTGLLAACGGGGGDGGAYSCAYIPGKVSSDSATATCVGGCESSSPEAVADGNQGSFATFAASIAQRTVVTRDDYRGTPFPAGSKAGALITFVSSASAASVTFNTSLDGVPQETFSGAALTAEDTGGLTPAATYLTFTNTLPFNGLDIVINVIPGSEYQVYEFCGDS